MARMCDFVQGRFNEGMGEYGRALAMNHDSTFAWQDWVCARPAWATAPGR
jgi:hypothetical protein